jgi:hypothetical protein
MAQWFFGNLYEAVAVVSMPPAKTVLRTRLWAGRILSILSSLFFVMDGSMKLVRPAFVIQATRRLGYPESTIIGIGVALLVCTMLYAIPRTSILGAILLTGYLGGAVASNVRASTPTFNVVFPILFAIVVWCALALRNRHLSQFLLRGEEQRLS